MASHILCWAVLKLDLLNLNELGDSVKKELAERLLKAICILTGVFRFHV